jgi:TolB protein
MKTLILTIASLFVVLSLIAQNACNNYYVVVSPDGQHLYFSSDRNGAYYEFYKSDLDGYSNLVQLTNSGGNKFAPSFSPDGSKIVFQQGDYGSSSEIYVMNIDGSNLTQLTSNTVYDGSPCFSPDGQKIVFSAWDNETYPEIFTMDADGSNRAQITNLGGAYWQSTPKYNPAGNKIYFMAGFNADDHIVMMDLDGSNWVDITPPGYVFGYMEANLSFSPDGSKIIFFTSEYHGYGNGGDQIIANADGSDWKRITNSAPGEYFYQAGFHPSNSKLYISYFTSGGKISVNEMNLDGTNMREISSCSLTGIQDVTTNTVPEYYPNPANEFINVIFPGEFNLRIYDLTGRTVFHSSENYLDISELDPGIYTLHFKAKNSNFSKIDKLVISK